MPVSRPSIPDRKRFDSDVRALLRQPSTPWITFDRDSRVPQGEVSEALVALPAMFPVTEPQPVSEPSSFVVASEIEDVPVVPTHDVGRRRIWFAAGAVAMVGAAVALLVARGDGRSAGEANAKHAAAAPVATDRLPPDLALAPPPSDPEPAKAPPPKSDDPRAKLGRLSIRGVASAQWVFFDGKRLLGRGARSFDVMCGTHTIAIGKRDAAQPVDVPCMGEYVVER